MSAIFYYSTSRNSNFSWLLCEIGGRQLKNQLFRVAPLAGFDFTVHAHLLRHACGYYLANKGVDTRTIQDYLGHANIQNTVRYTQLSAARFEGLWN